MIGIVVLTLLIAVYQIFFKAPKREYALQTASLLGRYRYTMLHPTEGFSAVLRVASGLSLIHISWRSSAAGSTF